MPNMASSKALEIPPPFPNGARVDSLQTADSWHELLSCSSRLWGVSVLHGIWIQTSTRRLGLDCVFQQREHSSDCVSFFALLTRSHGKLFSPWRSTPVVLCLEDLLGASSVAACQERLNSSLRHRHDTCTLLTCIPTCT